MNTITTSEANEIGDGGREERGRQLAKTARKRIKRVGQHWAVPSATNTDAASAYVVDLVEQKCTCPDFELRHKICKHQHAVLFWIAWQDNGDGTVTETRAMKVTYSQDWPAYNQAQVREQEHVETLLAGLCDGIVQPPQKTGRPRHQLRDLAFG